MSVNGHFCRNPFRRQAGRPKTFVDEPNFYDGSLNRRRQSQARASSKFHFHFSADLPWPSFRTGKEKGNVNHASGRKRAQKLAGRNGQVRRILSPNGLPSFSSWFRTKSRKRVPGLPSSVLGKRRNGRCQANVCNRQMQGAGWGPSRSHCERKWGEQEFRLSFKFEKSCKFVPVNPPG